MMGRAWRWAVGAALVGLWTPAVAHELQCEEKVGKVEYGVLKYPGPVLKLEGYPVTVRYEVTLWSTLETGASEVLQARDAFLGGDFRPDLPAPPFKVRAREYLTGRAELTFLTEEDCLERARAGGRLDSAFTVTFDGGTAQCRARVICKREARPEECADASGPTRGVGYWKAHPEALDACLAQGPVALGKWTVSDARRGQGLLWGSPVRYRDGTKRSDLGKARFLLAREVLAATCNERLGADLPGDGLVAEAQAALGSKKCGAMEELVQRLRRASRCGMDLPVEAPALASAVGAAYGDPEDPTTDDPDACR